MARVWQRFGGGEGGKAGSGVAVDGGWAPALPAAFPLSGDSPGTSPLGVTFRRPPETLGRGGCLRPGGQEVAVPGTEAIPRRHLVQPRAVPAGNMWRSAEPGVPRRRERRGGSGRGVAVLLPAGARRRRPPLCGGSSRSYGQFRDEKARETPARAVLRRAGVRESPSPLIQAGKGDPCGCRGEG